MEPDFGMAEQFLHWLDPSDDVFTFQTFPEGQSRNRMLSKVLHGSFRDHKNELWSANMRGAGVFVMINKGDGIIKPLKKSCRTNENVVEVRAVFVDLDGSPLLPVLEAAKAPDMVVVSSRDRWHAYWKVKNCPIDQFKLGQVGLAKKFNGDTGVNDPARVMRLPGFYHHKNDPVMTSIYSVKRSAL